MTDRQTEDGVTDNASIREACTSKPIWTAAKIRSLEMILSTTTDADIKVLKYPKFSKVLKSYFRNEIND